MLCDGTGKGDDGVPPCPVRTEAGFSQLHIVLSFGLAAMRLSEGAVQVKPAEQTCFTFRLSPRPDGNVLTPMSKFHFDLCVPAEHERVCFKRVKHRQYVE
jgi:hypothetical protein